MRNLEARICRLEEMLGGMGTLDGAVQSEYVSWTPDVPPPPVPGNVRLTAATERLRAVLLAIDASIPDAPQHFRATS